MSAATVTIEVPATLGHQADYDLVRRMRASICVLGPLIAEFDRLWRAAGGRIRLVTLAPEWPGSPEFIRHLAGHGVTASIGHSNAGDAAIEGGERHLGDQIAVDAGLPGHQAVLEPDPDGGARLRLKLRRQARDVGRRQAVGVAQSCARACHEQCLRAFGAACLDGQD